MVFKRNGGVLVDPGSITSSEKKRRCVFVAQLKCLLLYTVYVAQGWRRDGQIAAARFSDIFLISCSHISAAQRGMLASFIREPL